MTGPLSSLRPTDYSTVRLSQCSGYRTDDGTPHGRITEVRCPDKHNCLHFVPVIDDRLAEHDSISHRCEWIGARFVDNRAALRGHKYFNRSGITVLLVADARTQANGRL